MAQVKRSSATGTGRDTGSDIALQARGISKAYGGIAAVSDGRIAVKYGEIVALVGDNGAGKSTLVKVLSGSEIPDAGEILVDGNVVRLRVPSDAEANGVHTVYQDLALCNNLDAVGNLYLGHELHMPWYWGWSIDHPTMRARTKELLQRIGVSLRDVHAEVGALSGGQRQSLAISRTILHDARVVILDEPTNNLGVTQRGRVLELIRTLRTQGKAIILISHDLAEVQAIADRVFVMRLGRTIADYVRGECDGNTLVGLMTGTISTKPPKGAVV